VARDKCGAEMLWGDLEAAGIPILVGGTGGPEYADFYNLRHTFLTLGDQAGSTSGRFRNSLGTASRN
jgi:hypothetical protein